MRTRKELQHALIAIGKLTSPEIKMVLAALKARGRTDATITIRHSQDWLLPGLEYELRRRGLLALPHITTEWVNGLSSSYTSDADVVRRMLKSNLKGMPTQAELLNLGRTAAKALAEYVSAERLAPGRSFGPRVFFQHVRDIPIALNRSFPGYVASGLLSALIHGVGKT